MRLRQRNLILLLGTALAAAPVTAVAQEGGQEHRGAAALGLALRRLETTKRVLMIGAHPDDENNPVLAALALGEGADVAYLSLTRGEGGQNLVGPELQEGLGIIRSEELLAARALDGAGQYFTRAYDYGFSKSADEAFRHWPRDSVLADVVEVIRRYRPDVILSVWSGTARDGHGQHQASGIVTREAFEAAADPARFPGQVAAGLAPHRATRLVQSLWRGAPPSALTIETGTYDPLFGRSHAQIAMAGRSRHRSQDQGSAELAGPRRVALVPLAGDTAMRGSLFDGVATTLGAMAAAAWPELTEAIAIFERESGRAAGAFNPNHATEVVPRLTEALAALRRAEPLAQDLPELRFRIREELRQAERALRLAAGIELSVLSDDARVVPGQTFTLTLQLWNGGGDDRTVHALEPELPAGWTAEPLDSMPTVLLAGALAVRRFRVQVPRSVPDMGPWYLRLPRGGDMYRWPEDPALRTQAFESDRIRAVADLRVGAEPLRIRENAAFRDVDKALGERFIPVLLVPAVNVDVEPRVAVIALAGTDGSDPVTAVAVVLSDASQRAIEGTVRLETPAGWMVEPSSARIRLEGENSRATVRFDVRPPADLDPGRFAVTAVFEADTGQRYARGYDVIEYPHTRPRTLFEPATAVFSAFPVAVAPGLRVGYVEGAGDVGPEALAQLGVAVDLLDEAALSSRDLTPYSAIVTGIRAYEVRPELATANARLLEYVAGGGTLIVQYNKQEYPAGDFAPYPVTMAGRAGRVTDEGSPVRFLAPEHPVLAAPNRIGPGDFEGWVQERGLYFLEQWDDRYTPLLELMDPGEDWQRGSLLVTEYGRGRFAWVALSLFRQLPQAVPGAYRLLANLVSWGR